MRNNLEVFGKTKRGKILTECAIIEMANNEEFSHHLSETFSECELASYWVGVSLEDCAKSLDKITLKF